MKKNFLMIGLMILLVGGFATAQIFGSSKDVEISKERRSALVTKNITLYKTYDTDLGGVVERCLKGANEYGPILYRQGECIDWEVNRTSNERNCIEWEQIPYRDVFRLNLCGETSKVNATCSEWDGKECINWINVPRTEQEILNELNAWEKGTIQRVADAIIQRSNQNTRTSLRNYTTTVREKK